MSFSKKRFGKWPPNVGILNVNSSSIVSSQAGFSHLFDSKSAHAVWRFIGMIFLFILYGSCRVYAYKEFVFKVIDLIVPPFLDHKMMQNQSKQKRLELHFVFILRAVVCIFALLSELFSSR